jgi:phosphatidylserine/phosphatidylglycerophosphate/cardiolipin synthase-like enzyme
VRVLRSYEGIRAFSPWLNKKHIPWETLPAEGVKEIFTALKIAIDKAERYIYVEDQTLNPAPGLPRIYERHTVLYPSISAACARGVKVLFMNEGYAGPDSPVPAYLSMSPEIEDLILDPLSSAQRANFANYYVKDTKVHSKLLIVDDEFVSIGSANFWDRSMIGAESELNAMIVHPGAMNSLAADLRVRLWRQHLRVSQSTSVDVELHDLNKSLGLFRPSWGTGVTFPHPASALVEITA